MLLSRDFWRKSLGLARDQNAKVLVLSQDLGGKSLGLARDLDAKVLVLSRDLEKSLVNKSAEIYDPSSFQHLQLYNIIIRIIFRYGLQIAKLTIPESKYSALQLSVSKSDLRPNFRLFNTLILYMDSVCDLGITIDSNLCF